MHTHMHAHTHTHTHTVHTQSPKAILFLAGSWCSGKVGTKTIVPRVYRLWGMALFMTTGGIMFNLSNNSH